MGFVSRPDVTQADLRRQYRRPPSLVGHLPWLEYLPAPQCFLLEDGRSVGALFELEQVACEARPDRFLKTLRDTLQNAITHSIPEEDNPWVLQCYLQDEPDLTAVHAAMRDYVQPVVQGSAYTEHYLALRAQRGGGRECYVRMVPWIYAAPPLTCGIAVPLVALAPFPGVAVLPFGAD